MVVLNRIYTRTGDDGTTALGTGERRPKYDLRIAAYGTVDETNAAIGLARLHTAADPAVDAMLARCSIRLSTPPSEVARFHSCTLAAVAMAATSPPFTRTDSMPPKPPRIWRAAVAWPGCAARPG